MKKYGKPFAGLILFATGSVINFVDFLIVPGKRLFHNSGNRIVRGLINGLFHSNVRDIMTGQRAFSRLFVKTFPVLSKEFEIETEMTIHALDKNFLIEEIPVTYRDRPEGSVSKLNTVSDGIKVLKTIGTLFLEYKPFTLLAGLAVLIWVIMAIVFFQAKGTAMLLACGMFGMAGLMFFVCGIVLSVITKKHRKLYPFPARRLPPLRWEMKAVERTFL